MLARIELAIINVAAVIPSVADQVLPLAALPNATLAAGLAHEVAPFAVRNTLRKPRPNQAPSHREIRVISRQRPDGMDMIGQDNHRPNAEREPPLGSPHGGLKSIDAFGE